MFKDYLKRLQALQSEAMDKGVNVEITVRDANTDKPWFCVIVSKEGWYLEDKDSQPFCARTVYTCDCLSDEENGTLVEGLIGDIASKIEQFKIK